MGDKSRILLFTTAYRPFIGGSEIAIEEIAKRLPSVEFDIITPRYTRKLPEIEREGNVGIHRVGPGWLSDKFLFPWLGFLVAKRLIKEHEYQVMHAYQASHSAGAAWLLKLLNPGLRLVLTLQEGKNLESQEFWVNFFRNLIIKKADVITAISNYLKDYARRVNRKARIIVIPNGVSLENFNKEYSYGELSELADRLGIKPGEKVIITVSRLVPKNGLDILLRALKILIDQKSETGYKLIIAGEGEHKEELTTLADELGISEKVIWAGSVSHVELPKYLKAADVFARPSRSEGLGNAFLEAMAAGVPIIGTKVGGITDFLKNKETGLLAEVESPEDLAKKIGMILNDKNLAEKLKKNGRELVVEKYDWDKIAGQFRDLYASSL